MALQGTLKDFSLADIFQLIGVQKKTGVLTLKNREETVTISFLNGNVVAADSLPRKLEDRLGRVLVKSEVISEEQLGRALERQKRTLQRMGHVLVSEGFIGQEDLREALYIQVTQMIYRLFRWRDGQYHFSQEDQLDYDRQNFEPIGAETILMEGARILDEWPLIEKKLKSFSLVFRKVDADRSVEVESDGEGLEEFDPFAEKPEKPAAGEETRITEREATVFALVDGRRTVQDLVERCRLSEFDTCKTLYDLIGKRLIEEVPDQPQAKQTAPKQARPIAAGIPAPVRAAAQFCLVVVAAVLLLTSGWNPVRFSRTLPEAGASVVRRFARASSRARLQRIQFAVEIFYLQKGRFPQSVGALVHEKFLGEEVLLDPWGRSYHYEVFPGGYRLWGTDNDGNIPPDLSIEYRYRTGGPEYQEIARTP